MIGNIFISWVILTLNSIVPSLFNDSTTCVGSGLRLKNLAHDLRESNSLSFSKVSSVMMGLEIFLR
ncbi:hypothetical protein [Sulfurimonas sp.]